MCNTFISQVSVAVCARRGHLYVFFRPGVEQGGNVAFIMDGDEESSVNKKASVIKLWYQFPAWH